MSWLETGTCYMQTCVFYIQNKLISFSQLQKLHTGISQYEEPNVKYLQWRISICETQNQFLKKMIKVPYTSAHYPKSNKDQKRLCA